MKKRLILPIVGLALSVSVGAVSISASGVLATVKTDTDKIFEEVEDVYKFNDIFDVPSIQIEGATNITPSLVFPSGAVKTGAKIKLSEPGYYTLKYSFIKDNKPQQITKRFLTKYGLYYFSGSDEIKSSGYYGAYTAHGEGEDYVVHTQQGTDIKIGTSDTSKYPNTGIIVNLAKGERMTFVEPIELSKFNGSEFIQFFVSPTTPLAHDISALNIYLIDADNPDTYVRLNAIRRPDVNYYDHTICLRAAGQNQILTGYENNIWNGKQTLHVNDGWGLQVDSSFTASINVNNSGAVHYGGTRYSVPASYGQIWMGFDSKTNICYGNKQGAGATYFGKQSLELISDLDSLNFYDEIWEGFKSDRVYLAIEGEGYTGNACNVIITGLRDVEDMSVEYLEDVEAPTLTVDCPYDANNMPEAHVGKYYPVSKATAYDRLTGASKVKVTVDYNYTSGSPTNVEVKDGQFYVANAGIYRIKYTASDVFGNETTKTYFVHAGKTIEPLKVTIEDKQTIFDLGTMFVPQAPTITGGSGDTTTKIRLIHNDVEDYDISSYKPFHIREAGTWSIEYLVTDYAGEIVCVRYELIVRPSATLFIYDEPSIDSYLFNNVPYKTPLINCYDYSTGVEKITPCNVLVTCNEKTELIVSGESYTPNVNLNKETVSFKYFAGTTELAPIDRPVIDIGNKDKINVANYFIGAEDNIVPDENGLQVLAKNENETINWSFANKLLKNNASVNIGNIYSGKTLLSSLKSFAFKLTDADYPDKSVTLNATINPDTLNLVVSDMSYPIAMAFNSEGINSFTIGFADDSVTFLPKNSATTSRMKVVRYDDGSLFDGFKSNAVILSMTMNNVAKDNGIYINAVGGCPLSAYTLRDVIAPYTYCPSSLSGSFIKGTIFHIEPCSGADVLAPQTAITISVKGPSGNYATDLNGVKLENADASIAHDFEFSEYGLYQIILICEEINWHWSNKSQTMKTVKSIDGTAPVIKVDSEMVSTAHVGDTVYLPKVTITDDLTKPENLKVFASVTTPDMRGYQLDMNGGFKVTMTGDYYVTITATDEYYNTAYYHAVVHVEA